MDSGQAIIMYTRMLKVFSAILSTHPDYNSPQSLLLDYKEGRVAACSANGCGLEIDVGTLCFALEALYIPFNEKEARPRKFYLCSKPTCLFKPPKPWTNIRKPTEFRAGGAVSTEDANRVKDSCNLIHVVD